MRIRGQAPAPRRVGKAAFEILAAVAVSTGLVAALDTVTPIAGLGVIYLLAVLFVATRQGEAAALVTAILGVSVLGFFFIEPRYHLAVHDGSNVVALGVLLVAAVVVGRLATDAKRQSAAAQERARVATAREREAGMLAAAASSLLEGADVETQLRRVEQSAAEPNDDSRVRIELGPVPAPEDGELAVRLPTAERPGWLYLNKDGAWSKQDQERISLALARLIDVAFERERIGAKAAEAEATRRADVAKTAILHAISHDFRSPLTAITTAASGLSAHDLAADDRAELASVLETESARLSRLVDDLLDLSRIEADAVNPNPDWCDLSEVVARAAGQVRSFRGSYPIEVELPANLPFVHADVAQLERVFANLIENAVKFSPVGSPVRVSGGIAGDRVIVRVLDNGPGIPRSQRTHIFDPFVRGDDSGRGSGLGLAICRGFVEANGGRIALQVATAGETSFAVSFPCARQPVVA